jgi:hypothetical protein
VPLTPLDSDLSCRVRGRLYSPGIREVRFPLRFARWAMTVLRLLPNLARASSTQPTE